MRVLLPILSVLAGWSLLGVLAGGLFAIMSTLERVRRSLEKIAMGVRAIEKETQPLGSYVETLTNSLGPASGPVRASARHLGSAEGKLEAALVTLKGTDHA